VRVKHFNQVVSLLMIYLILSLTIAAPSVYATIYSAEMYGTNQVPGIIKPTDNLVVRAQSIMPCSIRASFTNNAFTQMNCQAGPPMNCVYNVNGISATDRVTATIQESGSSNTANVEAYVDNLPPRIEQFNPVTIGWGVQANYYLTDSANMYYPTRCSGIKKVDLLINNQVVNTTSYPVGQCVVTGSLRATVPNLVGMVNTSLKIYDYLDQPANRTGSQVLVDSVKPAIRSSSVKVYQPGTEIISNLVVPNSSVVRDVDVMVVIDEYSMDETGSVFGDFTEFDWTRSTDQSHKEAGCTRNMDNWIVSNYTCVFSGVRLSPSSLSAKFPVRATDKAGNLGNITLTATFVQHTGAVIGTARVLRAGTEDQLITTISTNANIDRNVDVHVGVTDRIGIVNPEGNFTELHRTLGASQNNKQGECILNETASGIGTNPTNVYDCIFSNIVFNPDRNNPRITINVTDETGKEVGKMIPLSFTNVPNAGTVSRLGPGNGNCLSQRCYVPDEVQNITAEFTTSSTFYESNIFIQNVRAECEKKSKWECQADVNFNLNDQKITLTGHDDLGNPINASANITVDPAAPSIISLVLSSPNTPDVNNLYIRNTLIINLTVNDMSPIKAYADLSGLGYEAKTNVSGTCQGTGNVKSCIWRDTVNILGPSEVTIPLRVIDSAGQDTTTEASVYVKELTNETPNLWNISVQQSPKRVNKRLMTYYPRKVYAHVKLSTTDQTASALDVNAFPCMPQQYNVSGTMTTYGAGILLPEIITKSDNKQNLVLAIEVPAALYDTDKLVWNCNLSLKTSTAVFYYEYPEMETYNITLQLDESPLMSEPVADEAKKLRDELNGDTEKTIRAVDKYLTGIEGVCGAIRSAQTLTATCNSIEIIVPWPPVKELAKGCGSAGGILSGKLVKVISGMCDFITCNEKWNNWMVNAYAKIGFMDDLAKAGSFAGLDPRGETTSDRKDVREAATKDILKSAMNPQESIIASILTLCPSGIIHNVKKLQVMKCEKIRCLEQDVPAGLPPTECEKNYKYAKCQYWVGAFFAVTPGLNLIGYVGDQIKAIVSDPISMASMIIFGIGCNVFPQHLHGLCQLPKTLETINSITTIYAELKNLGDFFKGYFGDKSMMKESTPTDVCDQITKGSPYADLPYDIRTGALIEGKCINNGVAGGCPAAESGSVYLDAQNDVRSISSTKYSQNNYVLTIQTVGGEYANLNSKTMQFILEQERNPNQPSIESQIEQNMAKINQIKTDTEKLGYGKDGQQYVADMNKKRDEIQQAINDIEKTLSAAQTYSYVQSKYDEAKKKEAELKRALAAAKGTSGEADMRDDVAAISKQVQELEKILDTKKQEISELQSDLAKKQRELAAIPAGDELTRQARQKEIDALQSQITGLTEDVTTAESYLQGVENNRVLILESLGNIVNEFTQQQAKLREEAQKYTALAVPEAFRDDPEIMNDFMWYTMLTGSFKCTKDSCTVDPVFYILTMNIINGFDPKKLREEVTSTMSKDRAIAILQLADSVDALQIDYIREHLDDTVGTKTSLRQLLAACPSRDNCQITGADARALQEYLQKKANELQEETISKWWGDGGIWQTLRSSFAIGRSIHYFSSTTGLGSKLHMLDFWRDWTNRFFTDNILGIPFDLKYRTERMLCKGKLGRGSVGASTVMSYDSQGLRHTAAHIEGEAEELFNNSVLPPVSTGNYSYVITAGITNSVNKTMEFEIILDDVKVIQELYRLNESQSFRLGGGGGYRFIENKIYSKACIYFHDNPHDFFDEVFLDDGKLCNDIIMYSPS
jgi:hypothetical protein